MATWYTDLALNQQQGVNFPGFPGSGTLTPQPGTQNNPQLQSPVLTGIYTWTGAEAANDIINIGILHQGVIVDPSKGTVSSGLTAPAATLTVAIGDNDLAIPSLLPISNGQAYQNVPSLAPGGATAPNWVSGTTYAPGNVVTDPASTPANQVFLCVAATSGTTAPHSAATTVWMPISQRYSGSIDIHAASGLVNFAGGTQLYGGPASLLPYSILPNIAPIGLTANQIDNQPYQIQNDCWAQALILTAATVAAGAVSVFRIPLLTLV